jgi:hypothetical protein
MNAIWHNYHCRSIAYELFTYWSFLVTLPLPLLQSLQNCYCYICYCYRYFHTTLLLNILLQILSLSGVVELTTQLLILENILCLPFVESINLGWILYPRKLLRSPILVGYHIAIPRYIVMQLPPFCYYDTYHHCHIALHDHIADIVFVAQPPFIIFYTCYARSLPSWYTARGIHIESNFVLILSCNFEL